MPVPLSLTTTAASESAARPMFAGARVQVGVPLLLKMPRIEKCCCVMGVWLTAVVSYTVRPSTDLRGRITEALLGARARKPSWFQLFTRTSVPPAAPLTGCIPPAMARAAASMRASYCVLSVSISMNVVPLLVATISCRFATAMASSNRASEPLELPTKSAMRRKYSGVRVVKPVGIVRLMPVAAVVMMLMRSA